MSGYFVRIWQLRYFWMAMVRSDLRNRYRRSLLGIGWSLLHPIAMTIVLCVVFSTIMSRDVRSYAPLLLSGLTFWGYVTACVMQGCQCFFQGESYIRQQPAPLAIYPLRTVLGAGFHFLLGLGIAIAFVWYVNGFGNAPALLSLIPTLLLLFIIGWAVAICAGVVNVLFQDSQHLIQVVMQALFYLTPIMYTVDMIKNPRLERIMALNPLAILLDLIRQPLLHGCAPSLHSVVAASIIGATAVGIAAAVLARFEKRMVFYL